MTRFDIACGRVGIHTSSSADDRPLKSLAMADILCLVSLIPLDGFPFNTLLMKTVHLVAGRFLGSWPIKDFFLSSRRSATSFFSGDNSFFFLTTVFFFGFAAAFFFLAGAFAVFFAFVVVPFALALGAAFVFVADFAAVRPVVLLAVAVAKPRTATLDL